jgi:hypothetical protein
MQIPGRPYGFTFDGDGKLLFTTRNPPVVNIIDLKFGGPAVPLVGNTSILSQTLQHIDGQGLNSQFY